MLNANASEKISATKDGQLSMMNKICNHVIETAGRTQQQKYKKRYSTRTMKFSNLTLFLSFAATAMYAEGASIGTCKQGGSGMVSTADPSATQVGLQILEEGGTAVDAMVAVQAVLGLVEPQSSGLGGGSFAVYYDASTSSVTTFDGRETAPMAATEDRFAAFPPGLQGFAGAWQSGLSVGVPGTPLLLETMLDKYGTKSMSDLFQPAIDLANTGFPMGGRTYGLASFLFGLLNQGSCDQRLFFRDPMAFEYMVNNETCEVKSPGTTLTNPEYAATLEKIATMGANAGFYTGEVADAIATGKYFMDCLLERSDKLTY